MIGTEILYSYSLLDVFSLPCIVLWLGADSHAADILVNVSHEAPSWWVWVTEDMVPNNVEEWSGIDDESYVIVSEEHVVEAVAHFMARCIMSNPKTRVCLSL